MKNIPLICWIGLAATLPVFAQNEETGEARQAKGRVAWFVYTSLPQGLENPVTVLSGKDLSEVTLSKRSPSNPVKIPADGIIRIVRKVENPKDPGKSTYLTLAQAGIPEGMGKALIILMPVQNNPDGLLFQTRIQDLATFKGGDCLYLNMTKLKVGVELGKSGMEINPGESKIQSVPGLSEPVNMPIRYSYFDPVSKQWDMLSASTVAVYPTRRDICIFSWDPNYNRVDYHGITFPVAQ
jgi:hypothetical protein